MKPLRNSSPWTVLGAILIGTFIGTLGNSMASITIPSLMEAFQTPLSSTVWVVTLYTVVFSILMPVFGVLGTIFGPKRLYMAGISLVALASLGSALAPSFPFLLAMRVLLGIGIAPILPAVMVIISQTFKSNQRGRATGFWALANGGGHAAGPLIGGALVQHFGWPSVFLITIPLCFASLFMVWLYVPDDRPHAVTTFDYKGALSLTISALGLMMSLTQSVRWGWTSPLSLLLWAITIGSVVFFIYHERRTREPFVELSLFSNRSYVSTLVVMAAQAFALFGLLVALPVLLIRIRGVESQIAGVLISTLTLTMALLGPLAGRMTDLQGSRKTCTTGLVFMLLGAAAMLFTQSDPNIPLIIISATLILTGAGLGLIQSPVTAAVIQVVEPGKVGIATGIFHMFRFIVGSLGSTIFGLILEGSPGHTTGFYRSIWALGAVAAVALLMAYRLPGLHWKSQVQVEQS